MPHGTDRRLLPGCRRRRPSFLLLLMLMHQLRPRSRERKKRKMTCYDREIEFWSSASLSQSAAHSNRCREPWRYFGAKKKRESVPRGLENVASRSMLAIIFMACMSITHSDGRLVCVCLCVRGCKRPTINLRNGDLLVSGNNHNNHRKQGKRVAGVFFRLFVCHKHAESVASFEREMGKRQVFYTSSKKGSSR